LHTPPDVQIVLNISALPQYLERFAARYVREFASPCKVFAEGGEAMLRIPPSGGILPGEEQEDAISKARV
jgi:hypothetical protein